MNPTLERPKELRGLALELSEHVKLAAGETLQDRFKSWLANKTSEPRHCSRHSRTSLVVTDTGISTAYEKPYHPLDHPEPLPGVHKFRAGYRCPACCQEYAACPPAFRATSFASFDTATSDRAKALALVRAYVEQLRQRGRGFLLLVGKPGLGKTLLACNVIGELPYPDALYTRWGLLSTALRNTYRHHGPRDDEEEASPPLQIVQSVGLLVVDELGCTALAADEKQFMDETLKARYDSGAPTILLSNLPLPEFKTFVGDALWDRVFSATGKGQFIGQLQGESFRRTAGDDYLSGPAVHADQPPATEGARPRPLSRQDRFLLNKELAQVEERLEALYEVGAPPDERDERRAREIEARLKAA